MPRFNLLQHGTTELRYVLGLWRENDLLESRCRDSRIAMTAKSVLGLGASLSLPFMITSHLGKSHV